MHEEGKIGFYPVFGRREIRAREIGAREMEEKVGISLVWRTEESETRD